MTIKRANEQLPNGSIIYWSKPREKKGSSSCVLVECSSCNNVRLVQTGSASKSTGWCLTCMNRHIAKTSKGAWKGGYSLSKEGYIYLHHSILPKEDQDLVNSMLTNHNYVLEHRYVMAKQINRPLTRKEIVHHLNGIKNDNRPENLMLCSPSSHHKEEQKIVDVLKARIRELEIHSLE